jgi:hypothetical protein
MNMNALSLSTPWLAIFVAAPLAAQTVSSSISALTPLAVTATSGGTTTQSSLPAGPLPTAGSVDTSPAPGVSATLAWMTGPSLAQFRSIIDGSSSVSASGSVGPSEFLIEFQATSLAPVELVFVRESLVTPGMPWPDVGVDIGNDGTIDLPNLTSQGQLYVPTFGLQPLFVRVIIESQLPGAGLSNTSIMVSLSPDNNLSVTTEAIGCASPGWQVGPLLHIYHSFVGQGIRILSFANSSSEPVIVVLGLGSMPVLFPSMPWSGPACLLMPTPDLLLAVPVALELEIPLPAAVRPVTLHAQAVVVSPFGLQTSDAYRIQAF